jgi:adenosylhomocysteine nucleosidase
MLTGILAPMPEEISLILEHMQVESVYKSGRREFFKGKLKGKDCVAALSRIGKVASSVTAAVMIEQFKIDRLIVAGVAGAIAPHFSMTWMQGPCSRNSKHPFWRKDIFHVMKT